MSQNTKNALDKGSNMNGQHQQDAGPTLNVHSIYLKDLSFEAPHSPDIFNEEWKPKIDFDLQMESKSLSEADAIYEVVLHITVTIKVGEGEKEKPAFLIDIQQAGAFTVKHMSEESVKQILATDCATVLFPYAREMVSSLATRGGFPQLVLPPINFDAMYAHHLTQIKEAIVEAEGIPLV